MNPFKTPRKPRFVELARHRRRTMVRRLQTKIAANADEFGGRFTSHLAMSEPNRPPELDRWFDFKFLGLDRFTYWNVCLITAGEAFWDAVHNLAYERASAALSPEDWMQEHRFEFEPAQVLPSGKILTYRFKSREPVHHAAFDGRTLREQVEHLEREIVRHEPPAIHESFRTDRRYTHGIGLHAVVDAPHVDRAVIEAAIDRFRSLGEADWRAADPVPRERLPTMTQQEAFDRLRESEAYIAYSKGLGFA